MFIEVREGTHIQFLYQIFVFYMIVNLQENFIYNPGQSKPSKRKHNTLGQVKLYSLFWLDIYQLVANSLFFTFSKNQRVYYIFKWSIALANSRSHVMIFFQSLLQLIVSFVAVFSHIQCYWNLHSRYRFNSVTGFSVANGRNLTQK